MKKIPILTILFISIFITLVACKISSDKFDFNNKITTITREEGSGTRDVFTQRLEMIYNGENNIRKDLTSKDAIVASKTDVVMISIKNDPYSIGYISLGSLNDSVKPISIDGVSINAENVKNGSYKISRSFIIATKDYTNEATKDFINYILSKGGQDIVSREFIPIEENATEYNSNKPEGKIIVAGSSSVYSLMEKLKEAYYNVNPNAKIEIQTSDSTTGIKSAIDGTCDICMSSRELKPSEEQYLSPLKIALDGIAIIVNNINKIENLTSEQVRSIYMGETTNWNMLFME